MDSKSKQARHLTLAVSLALIAALYLARDVLIPFALAALVSFLLSPFVRKLSRRGVPRLMAVGLAMSLLLTAVGALGWIVVVEARDFANNLPQYQENVRQKTSSLREAIQLPFERATKSVRELGNDPAASPTETPKLVPAATVRSPEAGGGAFEVLRNVFGPMVFALTMLAMTLLFAVIMLLRPEDLRDRVIRLVGNGQISLTTQALDEASDKVSAYLTRQLIVNGALGTSWALGLLIIGVPNALLWGLLLVCLRFIPYVGIWIAATLPLAVSLATSSGWSQPLEIAVLFVGLELAASMVLEPWLYSAGTGISPLAVLLSTLFWSWLWGPIGLILATPMTVCFVVLGKYVPQLHFLYLFFSDAPALPPAARLYQRLLAQDHDEGWSLLKTEAKGMALCAAFDSILLPALSLSEVERKQGSVDEESAAHIQEGVQLLLDECDEPGSFEAAPETESPSETLADLCVLCMPARNTADALAAGMLDKVLRLTRAKTEVASLAEFVGETIEGFKARPVDVVIISAVPPSRFMHVRYICKRLAIHDPDLEIIVGMWTLNIEDPLIAERMPKLPHVQIVTSLEGALKALGRIHPRVHLLSETAGKSARCSA